MPERVDCVVIGAGVVGLAISRALAQRGRDVLVLEAEDVVGSGTSSRNSEVIHAGIYYPAGSLKARLCREGRDHLYAYCAERGVAHGRCGKLIVAAEADRAKLESIRNAAEANEVRDLRWVGAEEIGDLEPQVRADIGLMSPSTGIIDSHGLMLALQGDIENASGIVVCRSRVVSGAIEHGGIRLVVDGPEPIELRATCVVNAAGLEAQWIAASISGLPTNTIPPQYLAVGHYYVLSGKSPFRHLVYPIPEDGGLGVHVTLDLGGQAKFGPDVRWIDSLDYRFDNSRLDDFVAAIRSYYPSLDRTRLVPGYTGIRPKLSGPGQPAADFRIDGPQVHGIQGLVNLFGVESPGLTSSLAIGDYVANLLSTR